jgi:hypothetical protein
VIEFSCDWCSRTKNPQEAWILGIASETVGFTAVRREATILSDWDREDAVLPLAVHFCSPECKNKYMAELFDSRTPAEEEVVLERVEPAEVIKKTYPRKERTVTRISHRGQRHKRAA